MLTCTYRFFILAFLLSISSFMYAHVNVVYPVGNETFTTGDEIIIEWEIVQEHELLYWHVYYSIDSGINWIPIAINLPPSQLTYEWVIPSGETELGKIKVYMDNVGEDYIDYSGLFSIIPNTSPPSIEFPAEDLIIQCNVASQQAAIQMWLDNNGYALATNYCGTLTWTHDFYNLSDECGATGDAFVVFTATDDCGSAETEALIIVQDVTAPTLTSPAANIAVETNGQGNLIQLNAWLNSKGGAAATDACSSITWTNNFTSVEPTCGTAGSATVIFTALDACGNATTSAATFTITDQVNPTLLQPANNLSIPLGPTSDSLLQNWLANHGGANANDLGGAVTWQHNFSTLTDGCGASGSATVTFTASDPCGNSVNTVATVQVTDQTPPVFETNAINAVVSCDNNSQGLLQQWLDSHGGAIAADDGGDVSWQHNFNGLSDGCGTSGSSIVTFTATDPCGNSATTISTFQVTDTTPPVIETAAIDTIVYCPQNDVSSIMQHWLSRYGGASAIDQCGSVNWTHDFNATIDTCQLQASYPVTFTVWDECLNSQITSATFTIIDTNTITSVLNTSDMEFLLFPNPADDVLTVEWENNESIPVQLMLLDAFGRYVWSDQSTSGRIVIPVDKYAAGIYFLSCKRKMSVGMRMVIIE